MLPKRAGARTGAGGDARGATAPANNTTTAASGRPRRTRGGAPALQRNPGETVEQHIARLARETQANVLSPTSEAIRKNAPDANNGNNDQNNNGDGEQNQNQRPGKRPRKNGNQNRDPDVQEAQRRRAALLHRATRLGPYNSLEGNEAIITEDELRKHIDDWFDQLENGIRVLGLTKKKWPALKSERKKPVHPAAGLIDISERDSTEPRWQRRQEEGIDNSKDVDPFMRIEPPKRKRDSGKRVEIEDDTLASLWVEIDRLLKDWIDERSIVLESNIASSSWEEILERYKTYGDSIQDDDPEDDDLKEILIGKCASLGLSTEGHPLELQNRLMQQKLAAMARRCDLPPSVVEKAIQALAEMEVPGGVNKRFNKRTGRKLFKDAPDKKQLLKEAEFEFQEKEVITISRLDGDGNGDGNGNIWTRLFRQTNPSGDGFHCFYRAIAQAWMGNQREWRRVREITLQLYRRALEPDQEGEINTIGDLRKELYQRLAQDSRHFDSNMLRSQWGDANTAQIVADALDIQIFMWVPGVDLDANGMGQISRWGLQVRGRAHETQRQIHLINWPHTSHWTVLEFEGNIGEMFDPTARERTVLFGNGRNTVDNPPELPRLLPDDPANTDLRSEARIPPNNDLGGRHVDLGGEPVSVNSISSTSGDRQSKKKKKKRTRDAEPASPPTKKRKLR